MDVISTDLPQFMRLIIALAIVLILMGGLSFVLKKLGLAQNTNVKSGDKRRLKIIESLPLDARRRVIILQRDDKQHVVILGANSETVIEKDIPLVDGSDKIKNGA